MGYDSVTNTYGAICSYKQSLLLVTNPEKHTFVMV